MPRRSRKKGNFWEGALVILFGILFMVNKDYGAEAMLLTALAASSLIGVIFALRQLWRDNQSRQPPSPDILVYITLIAINITAHVWLIRGGWVLVHPTVMRLLNALFGSITIDLSR